MQSNLTKNEKEVIKLIHQFKKRVTALKEEGKYEDDVEPIFTSFETLLKKLENHAAIRSEVTGRRDQMKNLIKDNAVCPKCNSRQLLKHTGERKVEEGWMCNVYKCRKCNIEFVWARPNNPWDMRNFLKDLVLKLNEQIKSQPGSEEEKGQSQVMVEKMEGDIQKLSDALDSVDAEYAEMLKQDESMAELIHNFKNYLLIEKIKMDTYKPKGS